MKPQSFAFALSAVIACFASATHAQSNHQISIFADSDMQYCALAANPGIRSVHIFHTAPEFATASRFSAPKPECWRNASWVADRINPLFLALGNSQTDLSVAYYSQFTGCSPTPVYVGAIDFMVMGVAPLCCEFVAKPPLGEQSITVVDCFFQELEANAGSKLIINPGPDCPCTLGPPIPPPPQNIPPSIGIYGDAERNSCSLNDVTPGGLRTVHMFHLGSMSATASQFAAPRPACWTGATWVGDQIEPSFLVLGDSQTNISIAYSECLEPPIYLGRVNYYGVGTGVTCCEYPVVHADGETNVWLADCSFRAHAIEAAPSVVINPTLACQCGTEPSVPVQSTTWGRIKAMYRSD